MHMYMSIIIEVGRPSSLMYLPLFCLHALVVCTAGCSILGEIFSTLPFPFPWPLPFRSLQFQKSAVGSDSSPLAVVE